MILFIFLSFPSGFLKLRLEAMKFINPILFFLFLFYVPCKLLILLNCVDYQERDLVTVTFPLCCSLEGLTGCGSSVPLCLSVSLSTSQDVDVLPFNNDAFLCRCCFFPYICSHFYLSLITAVNKYTYSMNI